MEVDEVSLGKGRVFRNEGRVFRNEGRGLLRESESDLSVGWGTILEHQ